MEKNNNPLNMPFKLYSKVGEESVYCKQAGIIILFDRVLLPDGTRSGPMIMEDLERGLYRRMNETGKYIYGSVICTAENKTENTEADLIFVDEKSEPNLLNPLEKQVYDQLAGHEHILEMVKTNIFADDLYGSLVGNTWSLLNLKFTLNARASGKIVAKLRGKNECYMDFFGSGTESELQEYIAGALCHSGFDLEKLHDFESNASRAMKILEYCEAKPQRCKPLQWLSRWLCKIQTESVAQQRMLNCCLRGKTTLAEMEEFQILLTTPND